VWEQPVVLHHVSQPQLKVFVDELVEREQKEQHKRKLKGHAE
jgi:hypothetical protein